MRFHDICQDILAALNLLTRLPVPQPDWETVQTARAAWAYPLVGLVAAMPSIALGYLAWTIGFGPMVTAAIMLIAQTFVTGAMHEDGLADCVDGFWGGWEKDRRLEIMRDSHIGAYGVLALVAVFALKWSALSTLLTAGQPIWIWAVLGVMSRGTMVWIMGALPHARDDGLSVKTGRPPIASVYVALGLSVLAAVAAPGFSVFALCLGGAIGAIAVGGLARIKIGGQTGDVLGATQQVSEVCLLLAILVAQ